MLSMCVFYVYTCEADNLKMVYTANKLQCTVALHLYFNRWDVNDHMYATFRDEKRKLVSEFHFHHRHTIDAHQMHLKKHQTFSQPKTQ